MHHYHRYIHRYITYHINCTSILVDFLVLHFAEFVSLLFSYISPCILCQFLSLFSVSIFPLRLKLEESFSNSFLHFSNILSRFLTTFGSFLYTFIFFSILFVHRFQFLKSILCNSFHPDLFSFSALSPATYVMDIYTLSYPRTQAEPSTTTNFLLYKEAISTPFPPTFFSLLPPVPLFSPFIQANKPLGHTHLQICATFVPTSIQRVPNMTS